MSLFCYFYIFFIQKVFTFFVSLYKELLEPTFSACLIALDNFCEVFGCSVIAVFISTMSRVWKVLGW